MKKEMKTLFLGIGMSALCLTAAGCGGNGERNSESYEKEKPNVLLPDLDESAAQKAREILKKDIEETNAQCPIDMGMMGQLVSMSYNEDTNTIVTVMELSDMAYLQQLEKNREKAKNGTMFTFAQEEKRDILQSIVDAQASMIYVYKSAEGQQEIEIEITHDDLEALLTNPMSDEEINTYVFENYLENEKAMCPYPFEDGMQVTDVKDDGNNVVYTIMVDEDFYDMAQLTLARELSKMTLLETYKNDLTLSHIADIIAKEGRGITYRMKGNSTGIVVDLNLSNNDIVTKVL